MHPIQPPPVALCVFSVLHCRSANLFCFFFLYIRSAASSPLKIFESHSRPKNIKHIHMKHFYTNLSVHAFTVLFCFVFLHITHIYPTKTMLSSVYSVNFVDLFCAGIISVCVSCSFSVRFIGLFILFILFFCLEDPLKTESVAHFTDLKRPLLVNSYLRFLC